LEVGKCSNLHSEVQKFLKEHGLSSKYEGPILTMVREGLGKREGEDHLEYIEELQKVKDNIEKKKNMYAEQELKEHLWSDKEGAQPMPNRHHKSNKENFPHN
jgi:hypothetical protein